MTSTLRKSAQVLAFAVFVFAGVARAQERDIAAVGQNITVAPGETRGDVACVHCTVYVRGTVKGDIAVLEGRVVVDGTVTGDVAAVLADIRLGDSADVGGDVAAFGGALKRSSTAAVHGQVTTLTRNHALVAIVFMLILTAAAFALLTWLVVWLFTRRRAVPGQLGVPPQRRSA